MSIEHDFDESGSGNDGGASSFHNFFDDGGKDLFDGFESLAARGKSLSRGLPDEVKVAVSKSFVRAEGTDTERILTPYSIYLHSKRVLDLYAGEDREGYRDIKFQIRTDIVDIDELDTFVYKQVPLALFADKDPLQKRKSDSPEEQRRNSSTVTLTMSASDERPYDTRIVMQGRYQYEQFFGLDFDAIDAKFIGHRVKMNDSEQIDIALHDKRDGTPRILVCRFKQGLFGLVGDSFANLLLSKHIERDNFTYHEADMISEACGAVLKAEA